VVESTLFWGAGKAAGVGAPAGGIAGNSDYLVLKDEQRFIELARLDFDVPNFVSNEKRKLAGNFDAELFCRK